MERRELLIGAAATLAATSAAAASEGQRVMEAGPEEKPERFYVLHEYMGGPDGPHLRMRYHVTNVPVPERSDRCENYKRAIEASIAKSNWFPSNGWQMALPEEDLARRAMEAAADAANGRVPGWWLGTSGAPS